MVDGYEIAACSDEGRRCAVVDLDGTLLRGNSLRMFIRFLVKRLLDRRYYRDVARILSLLVRRRLHLISHVEMKHPIHRLASEVLTATEIGDFVESLRPAVNGRVMSELEMMRSQGWRLILATAAPELYVGGLCKVLKFDAWTATLLSPSLGTYVENRGSEKLERAVDLASRRGWTIGAVITDHDDDLPLLTLPRIRRLLVSPTSTLCKSLKDGGLTFDEIRDL